MKSVLQFINKIIRIVRDIRLDRRTRSFIVFNKRIFLNAKGKSSTSSEALFELNGQHSSHIAYSYLANVLAQKHNAKIIAYVPDNRGSQMLGWIKYFLLRLSPEARVYRSFGASRIMLPRLSWRQKAKAREVFSRISGDIKSKKDIESLAIDGVWIGDLIYDSYLRHYKKPTIDITSADFLESLKNSIELYVFWKDYIAEHEVKAINVSHCVYFQAIPLRVAVAKNIPVYQINATHAYRLDAKNLFAYNDFLNFRQRFSTLLPSVQEAGLKQAEERINRRLAGEVGVDMAYSTKSAYGDFKQERLLKPSTRKKILIATHCFFDSPHSYGNNLFPDFYEWLDFLGRMTERTDYDWYIKTHPDYLQGTKEIIDSFVTKYPRFNCLPADSSHHQLIAEGIDVALTVYGTIGFEYAAMGIPVINASLNNPHVAYDFNLHPKSINEYKDLLLNLDGIELKIDRRQVYEYYFMRHIYNTQDWLLGDYNKLIESLGGYKEQITPKMYEKWLEKWTQSRHADILNVLEFFVDSKDFRLDHKHIQHAL